MPGLTRAGDRKIGRAADAPRPFVDQHRSKPLTPAGGSIEMTQVPRSAQLTQSDLRELAARIDGTVVVPTDAGWDEARKAWNLAADQWPAAVAVPDNVGDVVEIVEFAREAGFRVAPQGTGHGAKAMGDLADTILVKLHNLRSVTVDPESQTVRAGAGTIWIEVVEAAAEHGLAALAGSSPDVGVVGYTLGGGLSWLGRKYGIGANQVTAIEVVTADGHLHRVDRDSEPDLFWALRGGGGNFGIVTAIEFNLFPISEVYAGILWFPVDRAGEVLSEWRAWTDGLPDETTSVGRILQLPPLEEIPEPVRGKSFVVVEVIHCGSEDDGRELVAPLRALGPVMDTIETISLEALAHMHMDPEHPVPGSGDGMALDDLDADAIDAVVSNSVGAPLLSVEIRHLGGAIAESRPEHGAVSSFDAPFILFAIGITPTPEALKAVEHSVATLRASLARLESGHTYLNFAETRRQASTLWSETSYHRLRRIKAAVDPLNLIRSNHELI
jgi:FAD/FMN-containing dehydrogenase